MYKLQSIARFYTEYEALQYCIARPRANLIIRNDQLDGRFHVYDMDANGGK